MNIVINWYVFEFSALHDKEIHKTVLLF